MEAPRKTSDAVEISKLSARIEQIRQAAADAMRSAEATVAAAEQALNRIRSGQVSSSPGSG